MILTERPEYSGIARQDVGAGFTTISSVGQEMRLNPPR